MAKWHFKFVLGVGELDPPDAIWALKFHPNPTASGLFAYVVRQGVRAYRLTDTGFELLHSYDLVEEKQKDEQPVCERSIVARSSANLLFRRVYMRAHGPRMRHLCILQWPASPV